MTTADILLSLQGSTFLAVLFLAVSTAGAFLFYRFTLPPLPTGRKILLSLLRAVSLSLLLLLLFEPILRIVHRDEQPPVVAVLIDDSQSMTIRDRSGIRGETVRKWLSGRPLADLGDGIRTGYYSAASALTAMEGNTPDSLKFKGETTDLSKVFMQLKELRGKSNIQAAVLLTDGNYTIGKNPLYDAEALGIPVTTVGVGDTAEQKDILISRVVSNSIAFAGTRLPVDVTVKSSGYRGENVEVVIAEGQVVLDRRVILLQEGTREYPLEMFIEPKEEGTKKYTISVSSLPGELTEKNNTRSFFIKVLKNRLKVTLLAGAPGPDVSAVRQVLAEDQHFDVRELVQRSNGEFYGEKFTQSLLDSTDCFVLVGFPSTATGQVPVQLLKEAVQQSLKPILFINATTTDFTKLQALDPVLPFAWSYVNTNEMLVFPFIPERQKQNTLIALTGSGSADSWQQLPPVYKTQTIFRTKPEAEMLASVRIQNIVINEPLVLTRNINRQKTFAITGHGVWRWRLMAQGSGQTGEFLSLLLTNAVRWLTTKDEGKNVRIEATKETFTTAEPVEFTAQVYDDQFRPVDNAEVNIELRHGTETIDAQLTPIGSGLYEGTVEGAGEGDYTFTGKAAAGGKVYGEDKGRFSVGQMNVEFIETKMNRQLLEQIAYRTGGKYYDLGSGKDIARAIRSGANLTPREIILSSEIELWNWQYIVALLILLLGTEWFVRKRNGML